MAEEQTNQEGNPIGRPLTAEEFAAAQTKQRQQMFATDQAPAYAADQEDRKKRLKNATEAGEG